MLFKLCFIQKTHLVFRIYIYMQIPQLVRYEWWHSSSLSRNVMQFTYLADNVRAIKNRDWSLFDYERNSQRLHDPLIQLLDSYIVSSSIYIYALRMTKLVAKVSTDLRRTIFTFSYRVVNCESHPTKHAYKHAPGRETDQTN